MVDNGGSGATGGAGGQTDLVEVEVDQDITDGSVTVIDTQLGGSTGPAKVIIRIADPLMTIDPSTHTSRSNIHCY